MQEHLLKNARQLLLREAEPRDAPRILAYTSQIAGESENTALSPGEVVATLEEEIEILRRSAASPVELFLLAEIDHEIVGMLTFRAERRQRIRHSGEFGISVLRQYWGLGIGGHLLAYLVNWANAGGLIRKINLHVRVDNASAIRLYQKHGFVVEGRITRSLNVRGEFIDSYLMGLPIDPLDAHPSV